MRIGINIFQDRDDSMRRARMQSIILILCQIVRVITY